MTILSFLIMLRDEWKCIPFHMNGNKPVDASNAQLKRWCNDGAVLFNGERVQPHDEIKFPINTLSFFKGDKRILIQDSSTDISA